MIRFFSNDSRVAIVFFTCVLLLSCSSLTSRSAFYKIGFSAETSERFWVKTAVFDKNWKVPVGRIGCCAGNAGLVINGAQQLPSSLYLEWIDRTSQQSYSTQLSFPATLSKIVKDLPDYYLKLQQQWQSPNAYVIVSIFADNSVTAWVSNSKSQGDNISERVVIQLDQQSGKLSSKTNND